MAWEKLGIVYSPTGKYSWSRTHAYCPTPLIMKDCIRVYFAAWDENNTGRITFIDLDKSNPCIILYIHDQVVLNEGAPGTFDCDGVAPSYITEEHSGYLSLYYFGFQKTSDINTTLILAGLAISDDGGITFRKFQTTPILERRPGETELRSSLCVLRESGKYKVWYTGSIGERTKTDNNFYSKQSYTNYTIRYLEANSGLKFLGPGRECLQLKPEEFAVARPWVMKDGHLYKMWYSRRGPELPYSIGYAESIDGYSWQRKDALAGINRSRDGWDSEMMCFPTIIDVNGSRYMLYNGNNHGKEGFGLAIWRD